MPNSLWSAQGRGDLLTRIDRLSPDAVPRWGKMTAPQMLAHLTDWMVMAKGDLPTRPFKGILNYSPVKQLAIYWLPFPKGVPTARELISRAPEEWSAERATLRRYMESFETMHPDGIWPAHPAFGMLTPAAWGVLGYRHTHHHLTQFGV